MSVRDRLGNPDNPEQRDLEAVSLGISMEQFLASDHGKHLAKKAERQLAEGRDKLEEVDPDKPDEVRRWQNQCKVARQFMEWVLEPIAIGQQVEQQIHEEDQIDD